MATIAANLQAVMSRIRDAARAAGRDEREITLLAVSKTWPASAVRLAWEAGQRAFGENYAQEGAQKTAELAGLALDWHFIGPVQSNKTAQIAANFAWVHSIDRLKIAERLSAARAGHAPLEVCLQVNVSGEASKGGVAPDALAELAKAVVGLPNLRLRGLMAVPEPVADRIAQRRPFAQLRELRDGLTAKGIPTDTLSMGMSDDLEAAIAEGATLVRVGTAIFGQREKRAL
jgi:pyridoxal phosphate enzyme (YggS family)